MIWRSYWNHSIWQTHLPYVIDTVACDILMMKGVVASVDIFFSTILVEYINISPKVNL